MKIILLIKFQIDFIWGGEIHWVVQGEWGHKADMCQTYIWRKEKNF